MMTRLYLLLLLSFSSYGATLKVGTTDSVPYVIAASDSGVELDILKAVLPGHVLDVSYMTYLRALMEVEKGHLDIMAPMSKGEHSSLHFSKAHVYYQPVVFSLANKALNFKHMGDLANVSVASFQGASGYFGKEFKRAVAQSSRYTELPDLTKLIHLLHMGRVDVVVFNQSIFAFYWQQAGYPLSDLKEDMIFPLAPAYVVFREPLLRNQFDKGLTEILNNGVYEDILRRYLPTETADKIMLEMRN